MELEVPPCSDSELAMLLDKWSRRAVSRDPWRWRWHALSRASDSRATPCASTCRRSCTGQPTRRCAEALQSGVGPAIRLESWALQRFIDPAASSDGLQAKS